MSRQVIPQKEIRTCDKCGVTDADPQLGNVFICGGAVMETVQHQENASTRALRIDLCASCNYRFHLWMDAEK